MCHSSTILKRTKLKKCSYPFDWIYSKFDDIINCIEDDLTIFLNKNYYVDIQCKWNENQCGHSYYNLNMFNHHDPRKEKDYNYYIRCVNRFRNLLKTNECKLFVKMFTNVSEDNIDNHINETIIFNNKFKLFTNNYILLVIIHLPNKKQNSNTFTYKDNIHIL